MTHYMTQMACLGTHMNIFSLHGRLLYIHICDVNLVITKLQVNLIEVTHPI
jgi:hypothetical protein